MQATFLILTSILSCTYRSKVSGCRLRPPAAEDHRTDRPVTCDERMHGHERPAPGAHAAVAPEFTVFAPPTAMAATVAEPQPVRRMAKLRKLTRSEGVPQQSVSMAMTEGVGPQPASAGTGSVSVCGATSSSIGGSNSGALDLLLIARGVSITTALRPH